jgi:hypothetical protein
MMEAVSTSETSVTFAELRGAISFGGKENK